MAFDPYEPYGAVVESTVRVATWNVWGRYGDWDLRQAGLEDALAAESPDIVCLVEAWSTAEETQADRVAERLGLEHSLVIGGWAQDGWTSGIGVVSRWPVERHESCTLDGDDDAFGEAAAVMIDGPRGRIQLFVAMLDYPLDGSARRQAQVRQLAGFVQANSSGRFITVVCGDFNAGPDSDELRMLTGRAAVPVPGLVFYDSWELAGDGSAGITWDNRNPLAAIGRYPDRRFDYILSAWPRAGAAGHPVACRLLGVRPPGEPQISDHYGVLADLRY
jgi:endonuclease/exonuclease/phosphatase family metal-dependent hydrolase